MAFIETKRSARTYLRMGLLVGGLLILLFFVPHNRFTTDSFAATKTQFRFTGTVAVAPRNPQGTGYWLLMHDNEGSQTMFAFTADQNTDFGGVIPKVGDKIEVWADIQNSYSTPLLLQVRPTGNGSNGQPIDVRGLVVTAPATSSGQWVIRLSAGITQTVISDANTHFDYGVPTIDQWVEVIGKPQADGTLLAITIQPDNFETNEVVVRLKPGVISTTIASRYHLTASSTLLASGNIYLFKTDNGLEQSSIKLLSIDANVIWAELNFVGRAPIGNPARIFHWGGTDPSGYINQNAFNQIDLAPALAKYDGEGTVVAVLDTGVDLNHPVLVGHLISGWDMVADDDVPQDEGPGLAWGHGTHIAGIIAQIAPASEIMPVRVLDTNGRGNTFMLAYAIEWAVDHGANVINLSLGTNSDSHILRDTINEAVAKGVIVVAAAGNDNQNTQRYPAGYKGVIGVTAVDSADVKADFANYGSAWVDIAAPGVGITSTMIGPLGSGYASWSGTSMATSFVSGAAALLHQRYPHVDSFFISQVLKMTGKSIDALNPGYVGQLGIRLDIGAAANNNLQITPTSEGIPLQTPTPVTTRAPTPTRTPTPTSVATPRPGTQQPYKIYLPLLKKASGG